MNQVCAVWDRWFDRIAHDCIYGPLGKQRQSRWLKSVAVASRVRKRAACFVGARSAWNGYLDEAVRLELLNYQRAGLLRNCRCAGARLRVSPSCYPCRHAFCPYCRYRWFSKTVRKYSDVLKKGLVDLVVWQVRISEAAVMDARATRHVRIDVCDPGRAELLEPWRNQRPGLHFSRLWVQSEGSQTAYFHQVIVIGKGLEKPAELAEGRVTARHGLEPPVALQALGYCPGWLLLDWGKGAHVASWNRSRKLSAISSS